MIITAYSTVEEYLINTHAPAEVARAFRLLSSELVNLRKTAADHRAFISWIEGEIDDEDLLIRIIKRAKANPWNMNESCKQSIELFLAFVTEDVGCDHSVGICHCALRDALGIEEELR